ncbi:LUD domain-containing protein [bacterium]|nr:LUD domain-containing protein [bacterium]
MNDKRFDSLRRVLEEIDTELVLVQADAMQGIVRTQVERGSISTAAIGNDELLKDLELSSHLLENGVGLIGPLKGDETRQDVEEWHQALAGADVGITSCVGVASETGSALLPPHTPDERAMSLLPPVHWLFLREEQLVPDIGSLLKTWQDAGNSSGSAVMVTGPSRTADIEKELVLGVHGPQAVTLFLII